MEFITQEDIKTAEAKYGKKIPFGPIGEIVDVRTYRRYKEEDSTRESLFERDARVINYLLNLTKEREDFSFLKSEALLIQEKFAQLKLGPSSRTKWIGGTASVESNSASVFNCSTSAINRLSSFVDLFELLMLGTGVGLRVFQRDIKQLPPLCNRAINLEFSPYVPLPKELREEHTFKVQKEKVLYVTVGDSRRGWVDSLLIFLEAAFNNAEIDRIVFDLDSVRPLGERIKGFGGTSSGPEALQGILQDVDRILKETPDNYLRSIDCMDICCAIAKGVIAGSVRRSALITLFDEGDDLCANAKKGLYTDPFLFHKQYRSQSNNTECLGSIHYEKVIDWLKEHPNCSEQEAYRFIYQFKPSKEQIAKRIESIKELGEPAFDNYLALVLKRFFAARTHRPDQDPFLYCDPSTNP